MFERILVPLDGSELAEEVVAQVRRLLFYKDAEVLLVRAVSTPPSVEYDTVELYEILEGQAAKYLQQVANSLISQGARVRTATRRGAVPEAILDIAEKEKATLIAMSTHGRSGFSRWAMGSSAEEVVRASRIPVLVIRSFNGSGGRSTNELSLRKILVPLDLGDLSEEAVPPALELAKVFGSQVLLLHVSDTVAVPDITALVDRFREAGVSVAPVLKQGDPAAQILEACAEHQADLIAMTTHGRSGLSRLLMGSVTEKVLRASTVPLLIVRPSGKTSEKGAESTIERTARNIPMLF